MFDSRQLFSGTARYPLGVTVCDFHTGQDPELILDASEACFADGEAELLARRLWHLVESMMASPEARIEALPVLPEQEQWALLHGLHKDIARHDSLPSYITMFEHQVALRGHALALVWDGGAVDYATLERCASALAQRLKTLGCAPKQVLALAIERGPEMVLALLAIAKCGAAFLPLDPDAPLERIAVVLQQSQASALLIGALGAQRLGRLHAHTEVLNWQHCLELDAALNLAPEAQLPVPTPPPAPGDPAYVLFTSGSSGQPKGVLVGHGALSRRLAWLSRTYGANWQDCSAQATQVTFDPSLIELLLPLIHGGRVALPPAGRVLPESLVEFAIRHGVTIMAFVPSTLARFTDAVTTAADLKLRVACCGGEVLAPNLAERFMLRTGARLFNVYGPTETTIFATAWECGARFDEAALPLGRPIDDTRIYVLDEHRRALPMGLPGEIYIGGEALALGYLLRPELDCEVFVEDPFCPGARMYRTGDRGWLGMDGNLHFIGRIDRQVKLRGYRIELGEIEMVCLGIAGVRQAAAKLVEHAGKPQLHVWVAASASVSAQQLQSALRRQLPDYMIPSSIHVGAALAESSAGKIDYAALPEQHSARALLPGRAPCSALERSLLSIWEEVLGLHPIGLDDNFFDIGGDSLAAVTILAAIETELGRKIAMYLLAEHPTIERLAVVLNKKMAIPGLMHQLGPDNGRLPLYLAASGHGDLLRFQDLARALEQSYQVYMLQPPAEHKVASVGELAELYAGCIAAQEHPPGILAGFSVGGVAALETARLLAERGAMVRALVLIDTIYPKAAIGGTASWRMLGWLVRHLHIQELSMNGRRLHALFNDPGLIGQVMALRGYRPSRFDGPTILIRSSGLAHWDRLFFRPWRRLMNEQLAELRVPGLHGSIFEAANLGHLASALARVTEDADEIA
jgi:syringomycin synthetase protein SyrE